MWYCILVNWYQIFIVVGAKNDKNFSDNDVGLVFNLTTNMFLPYLRKFYKCEITILQRN